MMDDSFKEWYFNKYHKDPPCAGSMVAIQHTAFAAGYALAFKRAATLICDLCRDVGEGMDGGEICPHEYLNRKWIHRYNFHPDGKWFHFVKPDPDLGDLYIDFAQVLKVRLVRKAQRVVAVRLYFSAKDWDEFEGEDLERVLKLLADHMDSNG